MVVEGGRLFLYDGFAHLLDHVRRSQAGRIVVKVGIVRLKYRQPNICLRTNQSRYCTYSSEACVADSTDSS